MAGYNPTLLLEQLTDAGLPAIGADSAGVVQYSRELTPAEQTTATGIIAAHNAATLPKRQQAIQDAITAASALNGVTLASITTAAQLRLLLFLVIGWLGWVRWNGSAWVVRLPSVAEFISQGQSKS